MSDDESDLDDITPGP